MRENHKLEINRLSKKNERLPQFLADTARPVRLNPRLLELDSGTPPHTRLSSHSSWKQNKFKGSKEEDGKICISANPANPILFKSTSYSLLEQTWCLKSTCSLGRNMGKTLRQWSSVSTRFLLRRNQV